MQTDKILEYLRYLRKKIDDMSSETPFGVEHILPLQSELRLFRDRVAADATIEKKVRDFLCAADLNISPVHLVGSSEHRRQTWWMHLPWIRSILMHRHAKDRKIVEVKLSQLREYLHELYCLIEASSPNMPNQSLQPTALLSRG